MYSTVYNINISTRGAKNIRLSIVKTKNATQYYVIKSIRNKNGKSTSKIIEKLGNETEVLKKSKGMDPVKWAHEYIAKPNEFERTNKLEVYQKYSPTKIIETDKATTFNIGYLFLQKIYKELKLDKICKQISKKYKFEYDLDSILSRLIYTRILEPSSKLSSFESSKNFLEQPNFELQHIYRASRRFKTIWRF